MRCWYGVQVFEDSSYRVTWNYWQQYSKYLGNINLMQRAYEIKHTEV